LVVYVLMRDTKKDSAFNRGTHNSKPARRDRERRAEVVVEGVGFK
jgi:hypothetical protein